MKISTIQRNWLTKLTLGAVLVGGSLGCEATLGPEGGGSSGEEGDACTALSSSYLRLTPAQYQLTAEQLLGPLPDFTKKLGRQLNLSERRYQVSIYEKDLTELHVADLFDVSEAMVAERTHERWTALESCTGSDAFPGCAHDLVAQAGAVAFRRPLEDEETARYVAFLAEVKLMSGAAAAVDELAAAWLMAPDFLHRPQLGTELNEFELASLVSYTLSDGPPDQELFALAEAGSLSDPVVLETQVRRLLADPSNEGGLLAFVDQWLELDALDELAKTPELFPEWSEDLRADMRREAALVAREVLIEQAGQPSDLLTVDFTFVNQRLGDLYGLEGDFAEEFRRVALPDNRRGLLSLSGFLARQAQAEQTDIVHRGLFIRNDVLCMSVGAPPPNAAAVPPEVDEFGTQREELETVHSVESCAVCHQLIDPLGYAFEDYDAIGRFRSEENGNPILDDGVIKRTSQGDLEFVGADGLSARLAQLEEVGPCLTKQFYSYTLGRKTNQTDACVLREAETSRAAGSFVDGLVALLLADARRQRQSPPDSSPSETEGKGS